MENIKHIFFDLDHTLWDFETNSKKTYDYIFKKNNIQINIDEFKKIYEPINNQYWKLYREEKISKEKLKYGRLKDVFEKLNYSISDEVINILANEYLDNLSNYNQLFDGTIELLEYLKPNYKLHIITNGFHEIQNAKLTNSKILNYFTHIITSEHVGVKKPNPKMFFHALKTANAHTYQSIMIGDNLEADIFGAKNVGIKVIHCNFVNNLVTENVITVTQLSEVMKYL